MLLWCDAFAIGKTLTGKLLALEEGELTIRSVFGKAFEVARIESSIDHEIIFNAKIIIYNNLFFIK